MIPTAERPVVGGGKPPLPREHGAWGMLLIPFATAVGAAGAWDWRVALLLASVLCFYLARTSWLKKNVRWTVALLAGSAAGTLPLLLLGRLWWLAAFAAVAAPLALRKTGRSVTDQLLAVAGLTLTAPAAWYVSTGHLGPAALELWLLNFLYFAGSVIYVKMHVATAVARRVDKLRQGAPTMIWYGGLAVVAALWRPVGLAFVPAIGRAFVGVARLSPTLRIRRLAWTEVAYSVVYAALLIVAFRWR